MLVGGTRFEYEGIWSFILQKQNCHFCPCDINDQISSFSNELERILLLLGDTYDD